MRQLTITTLITERNHITEKYFSEISSLPMINAEKEIELARKIKEGDKLAEEELIKSNLRFVISCAKIYQNRGLPLEDLISEGNYGLIKAAKKFDETKGFKFISYAVSWIRQSILDSIYKNSYLVRLPINKLTEQNKLRNMIAKKTQQEGGDVFCVKEICEELKIDDQTYNILIRKNSSISLDAPVNSDSERTFGEVLTDEDCDMENKMNLSSYKTYLTDALSCLSEIEKTVLLNSFGLNEEKKELTISELSIIVNLSKERVRQIKINSLKKMKNFININFYNEEIKFKY